MRFLKEYDHIVDLKVSFAIAGSYVALALLGSKFMQSRQALELKSLKVVYNVTQVVVCTIVFANLLPFYVSAKHLYGLRLVPNATVEWWVLVYYVCKLLDFGDTIFIVLGKKNRQLSLLHLWHHSSIVPLFAWILSEDAGAGVNAALPLLNSLVHIIMYFHYFITSIFTFKNMWWKPIVTSSQMGHHAVLIVLMVVSFILGPEDFSPKVAIVGLIWGFSILGLFAKFYIDSYMVKKSGKKDNKLA